MQENESGMVTTRRTQRRRYTAAALRSAAGVAKNIVSAAARAARGYRPSVGMRRLTGTAAAAGVAGMVRKPAYRAGRRIYKAIGGGDPAATGNELTVTKAKVGRYPKLRPQRLLKLMQAGMTDITFRFQGITNFDTNVGWFALANRSRADIVPIAIPMHIYDLTSIPNIASDVSPGNYFTWSSNSSGAVCDRYTLADQNPDGSTNPSGYWIVEKSSGVRSGTTTTPLHVSKACHEWSDIRMNLYGARKRGTTFYIDIVRFKEDFSNLFSASVSNKEYNDLVRTLQAPLVYSNLQSHNGRNLRNVQFVKRFKFYVPGGSADDLDTIGKVKEFRLFLKQGNVYNYEWQSLDSEERMPHAQEDGLDFTSNEGPQNFPKHSSRLFMLVRAFSPERTVIPNGQDYSRYAADPLTEPSYDIVLRNKWLLPH